MDSAISQPENKPNTPEVSSGKSKNPLKQQLGKHKKKLLIVVAVAILVLLLIVFTQVFPSKQTQTGNSGSASGTNSNDKPPVPGAIAKVGEEYIFQPDLDVEMANYPGAKDDNAKKVLMEKLVKDSVVLQSAKKDKLASVSSTIYNTVSKDYGKRFATLKDIQTIKNSQIDHVEGGIVSVWFHNYEVPKMGLEKAKQMAFSKITALHKRVLNKEITLEQAGKIIQNDSSYAQLDVGYRSNAYTAFKENKGQYISVDDEFNKVLWALKPGEVSAVVLGRNVNGFSGKVEEAFYAFGQLSNKIENGNSQDFDKWVEAQKNNYEVIYY